MLALTAALVVPPFFHWDKFRNDFEVEAGRILGRPVTVKGDVSARLLPFPSIRFDDVEVAGTRPDEPAMTIESFSMDAELPPLMRGELLIFDMRLVRPRANISIAEDGTVDWALQPSTPLGPRQVSLEKLTVTEGKVTIHHAAAGRDHELTEVNADISAASLAGPWRINGSARLDGMLTRLAISTGAAGEDGRMRVRVVADPDRYGFGLETDGAASIEAGKLAYEGTFKVTAREEAKLRGSDGETFALNEPAAGKAEPKAPPYRVRGSFKLGHLGVEVPQFRFETGPLADPYTADGKASISLGKDPRFTIEADGAQIRIPDGAGEGTGGSGMALAQRLAGLRESLLDLPKPLIPGTIDVNLPAIVTGDTTIRDVRLSTEPVADGWSIRTLSATLPGRATLEASGLLATGEADFGFKGRMVLAVNQPSGFAAWLSKDVDGPVRRLARAGFSADVDLSARRQVFEGLELALGDAQFKGRMVSEEPADARSSMQLDLDGGRLDVEGLAAFASLFVSDAGAARWADHDLDLKVKAGPVTVAGVSADSVDTQLRLQGGELEVDRLAIGGLEGAAISATGTVRGIGTAPSGSIDATLLADDLGPLAALLAQRFPDNAALAGLDARAQAYPGLLSEAKVNAVASLAANEGGGRQVAVSAQGAAGGSDFTLTFSAEGDAAAPLETPFRLNLTAKNDDAGALYALYGLPALPLGFAEPAQTELAVDGTLKDGAATKLSFTAEGLAAGFDGKVGATGEAMTAEGAVSLKADDLAPWLMTAGQALPGMQLGLPAELTAKVDLRDALLVVSDLSGKLAGMAVNGDVNAQMRDGLPHITGSLDLDALDLGLAADAIFGAGSFEPGSARWPQAPFEPKARPPFTAELDITADRLAAGHAAEAGKARLSARLDREGLRVSDLSADWRGGRLSGLFELSNTGGTGLFSGQLTLAGVELDALLPDSGLAGKGDFGASLTASGKSVEGMIASLAGSGTARLADLSAPGVDPAALPAILAKADAIGPQINAAQAAAFAPDIVRGGRFEAGEAELALTVAAGAVRTPPVRLERADAVLTVEPRIDLSRGTVGATGEIEYLPGLDDRIAGADPAVRFSVEGPPEALAASYDTEPLAQYLTQRALEREQARVEAMQAVLLERQRLRRETRYYAALQDERARAEAARKAAEEQARLEAEAQARKAAEADAARKAAEEAAARKAAEQDAARKAAEEAAARKAAEQEAARKAAEEAAARKAAEDAARQPAPQAPAQGTQAPGLPGVQTAPLPPVQPRTDDSSINPGTLTVDGLLRAIGRDQ